MNIQEIRIGNWVEWNKYHEEVAHYHKQGEYGKPYDEQYLQVIKLGNNQINGGSNENYSGVKLTEEILLKCGFEHDTTDDVYTIRLENSEYAEKRLEVAFTDPMLIGNNIHVSAIQEMKIGNTEPTGIKIKDINFLHELQNLYFALTQTELDIKL